jgi:cytidylate kinase
MTDDPRTGGSEPVDEELMVVAIDGPAGSGKSTVGRRLAEALGLEYLDTGAMYRSVTFAALARGVDPDDVGRVAEVAKQVEIDLQPDGKVSVDGVDATTQIRGPEVSRSVSAVAANQAVRAEMVSRQREWARRRGGGVLEGRDIGTVVFPKAALKIYLTADAETRAARRAKEVTDLDYNAVAADLARRDQADSNRVHDPLRQADDAIEVDTTGLSIDEVVSRLVDRLRS